MQRCSAFLTSLALLTSVAAAQCLNVAASGASIGSGDETLFGPTAMGISFPMAGATGSPFTHCVVNTNGVLYLTNGGAATDANTSEYGDDPAHLTGAAGASPRVAAFWSDLVTTAPAGFVAVDTSVPGRFAVTWVQAREFFGATTSNIRAELFSTGVVRLSYSGGLTCETMPALVGVSVGNAAALPGASDLSAGPTTSTGVTWQQFDTTLVPFDLAGKTIAFTPSGSGYAVSTVCEAASLTPYGAGCYAVATESFGQYFATAAAASAALNGQSMRLVPTLNGYTATWGGGTFVTPPGGAVLLPANDDDETSFAPSIPLPVPGGTAAQLFVHTNGFVSTAAGNDDGLWNAPAFNDYSPSAQFRNAPTTAFWSWHDYNATAGGSIKRHEAVVGSDTILYVTWDAVESYAVPEVANPSTFQFQFNLSTGAVTYVWQNVTAIGTSGSTTLPEAHLIGYSPGGASLDPGSVTLATALPLTTQPDQQALALSATPPPVINPSTSVTFTVDNIPAFSPGFHISAIYFSFTSSPGVDLGFIDAPGCSAFIGGLDATLAVPPSATPTSSVALTFDNVIFMPGNTFYIQAITAFPPLSLPNGQNALGIEVSNAVRIYVNSF